MGCLSSKRKNESHVERGAVVFQHTSDLEAGSVVDGLSPDSGCLTFDNESQSLADSSAKSIVHTGSAHATPTDTIEFPTKRMRTEEVATTATSEEFHPTLRIETGTPGESVTSPELLDVQQPVRHSEVNNDAANQGDRRLSAVFQTALRNAYQLNNEGCEDPHSTADSNGNLHVIPRPDPPNMVDLVRSEDPVSTTGQLPEPLRRPKKNKWSPPQLRSNWDENKRDSEVSTGSASHVRLPGAGASNVRLSAALAKEFRVKLGIPSPERPGDKVSEADSGVGIGHASESFLDSESDSGSGDQEGGDSEPEYDYAHSVRSPEVIDGLLDIEITDDPYPPIMSHTTGTAPGVLENRSVATMAKEEIDSLVDTWENDGLQEFIETTVHKPSFRSKDAQRFGTMSKQDLDEMISGWELQGQQEAREVSEKTE
eukprot:m.34379 g.34379  ORF g.34379 m.34379 type:complete len:427 (+) comp7313_c0_seq2:129-1409(+)